LQRNGITFVSFDRGGKLGGDIVDEFLKDESITVFLLHAEKERSVQSKGSTHRADDQCRFDVDFVSSRSST
jgi:E3 ubiquitin-protein ligase SHPRH